MGSIILFAKIFAITS